MPKTSVRNQVKPPPILRGAGKAMQKSVLAAIASKRPPVKVPAPVKRRKAPVKPRKPVGDLSEENHKPSAKQGYADEFLGLGPFLYPQVKAIATLQGVEVVDIVRKAARAFIDRELGGPPPVEVEVEVAAALPPDANFAPDTEPPPPPVSER